MGVQSQISYLRQFYSWERMCQPEMNLSIQLKAEMYCRLPFPKPGGSVLLVYQVRTGRRGHVPQSRPLQQRQRGGSERVGGAHFLLWGTVNVPQKWGSMKGRLFPLRSAWRGERDGSHSPTTLPRKVDIELSRIMVFVVWDGNVKSEGKGFYQHNCPWSFKKITIGRCIKFVHLRGRYSLSLACTL